MSQPSNPNLEPRSTATPSTTPTASDAGPATVLHEHREVYRGRIFALAVDRVTLPSGHVVTMEVVRHPGSVVLLPMPTPDTVIVIRQYRYAIDRFIWELPAGSLEPGEDPRRGAARECEEEVGLVPRTLHELGELFPTPGFCDEWMKFYRCTDLVPPAPDSTARQDEDEVIEPVTMSVDEVRRMIRAGEIVDMKTVAGLALLG